MDPFCLKQPNMKNLLKKLILVFILIPKAFHGNCQEPLKYTPAQLKEDYSIFRKALETTYPSLYRFNDSVNMTRYLDDNFKSLNRPESETEFYKLIATACARMHDEHLIPQPSKAYYHLLG